MKVIIVEVTRAANTFGRSHLAEIREAYDLIAVIVEKAQAAGEFKATVTPTFAAMAFYGAIEQVLTGWIFDVLPGAPEDVDQAKAFVVETICGGLEVAPRPSDDRVRALGSGLTMPENELVKRLMWMGLVAGLESLASIIAIRGAIVLWKRLYGEEPPGARRMTHRARCIPTRRCRRPSSPRARSRRRARRSSSARRSPAGSCSPSSWEPSVAADPRLTVPEPPRRSATNEAAIAQAIQSVTASTQALVKDQVELAKLEMQAKADGLRQGRRGRRRRRRVRRSARSILILQGLAWLAWYLIFPDDQFFWGFFLVALILLRARGARRLPRLQGAPEGEVAGARPGDRRGARDAGDDPGRDRADEGPGARGRRQAGGSALVSSQPRTPEQIRASIAANQAALATSLTQLRGEVVAIADWRRQINRNRPKVLAGAAVAGFVIGGGIAAIFGRRPLSALLDAGSAACPPTPSMPGPGVGAEHRADLGDDQRLGAEDLAPALDELLARRRATGCAGRPRRSRRRPARARR